MESEGMLRHLAFFEELGKMDETDASWRSVSAGLVVLRLVDNWIADGATKSRVDSWGVSAVREAIARGAGDDADPPHAHVQSSTSSSRRRASTCMP